MRLHPWVVHIILVPLLIIISSDSAGTDDTASRITLLDRCPPSFEKIEDGVCRLVTLYDQYDSLQNKGVGGLKTALPKPREGFTAKQMDLGRLLFFDPLLSGSGQLSCASCHHPEQGLSDSQAQSMGSQGKLLHRSSPTLWNVTFLQRFFWDARSTTLEDQMLGPLYSAEEMGNTPENLINSLNNNKNYLRLFRETYSNSLNNITLEQVYQAIVAFESTLISLNSRYDQYAHGYHQALTDIEIKGLNVFRSFVARCAECHTPPLFTNQQIAVIGTPEPEGMALDVGAQRTFSEPRLKGAFKVPTLRNIAKTAPYMHSGKFNTLKEAVEFYTKGRGHAVPDGVELHLHWHIWEPDLQEYELDYLVAFLQTLTDEQFTPQIPTVVPSGLTPVTHIIE